MKNIVIAFIVMLAVSAAGEQVVGQTSEAMKLSTGIDFIDHPELYESIPCPDGRAGCAVNHMRKIGGKVAPLKVDGSVTIGAAQLAVLESSGNMTIHIDASRDWGTREIAFEMDDKTLTFTRDELKNMLEGKTYIVKSKIK